ncbi:MAG: CusA/CzcA family heavy metal efflux RND transporter [Agitococcus sp.]|nr:CusA/CzcA family heavy metal efflux RND transporter [Agitococcus sp.]
MTTDNFFDRVVRFSIEQRWLVLLAFIGLAALGVYNYLRLPIDAVPDITNVQVQINTEAQGYSPLEVESRLSFPIETVLAGLPHLKETRSLSRYGLSQVTVIFDDGTDIYFARQLVSERLQSVRSQLPIGLSPELGPIATGLGEIFMYTVENKPDAQTKLTPTELRTVQDWIVKPQLRQVKGVTEVNTVGGYVKQYLVAPKLHELQMRGLSVRDVMQALAANNGNVGAAYIEKSGEQYLVRSPNQITSLEEIGQIAVKTVEGQVIRLSDVATVSLGHELRTGAATKDTQEVVLGTVFMLIGENSRTVSTRVAEKLATIQPSLPEGVIAQTVYDRTTLVDATINTVKKNLLEGALLVIAVLFAFLGHLRAALITALVIPLAMLLTITGMVTNRVSANLMSLGALDFGIIIDGSVVIVESSLRKLAERQQHLGRILTRSERFHTVFEASKDSRQALIFGQLIIMVVYLPLLTLTGVEGKMFIPMALTVVMALMAAMVLSVTFVPAAIAMVTTGAISETDNRLMIYLRSFYQTLLTWALSHRVLVLGGASGLLVFCLLLATRLGSEFIPSLDEGDVALHALRIPGTSLTQAVQMQYALEAEIKKLPEVQTIFAKLGTAEIATDPMPPSVADNFVMLKARSDWPNPDKSKAEVVADIQAAAERVVGNNYEYTQPIQMRFNELISGVRSDVAVKVFGDDMEQLLETGEAIADVLNDVAGAADVKVEQVTGLPMLTLQPKKEVIARYGLAVADVQAVITGLIAGEKAGEVFEGDKRFELIVRLPEQLRQDIDVLKRIPVPLPNNSQATIPLAELVDFQISTGPNQVSRENGKRRVVVTANVRGRDIGSFVNDAQQQISTQVTVPTGYWLGWGGTFEQLQSAQQRLMIVIPVALLLILILLYASLGSVLDGLLVFTGVPLALTGGIVALALRDIPLSISAGVGFIALSGVAVLNGLVMLSAIRQLRDNGMDLLQAVQQGAVNRLRPVLMTALVAALGFIPMAVNVGIGAEVQRPLATVVIGGIISATLLTLMVLPTLYYWLHRRLEVM